MVVDVPEFPETLYDASPVPMSDTEALTKAIHRLATAVEHQTLAILDQRIPAAVTITTPPAAPVLASLPPVQGNVVAPVAIDGCPIHRQPWKVVPAGISKSSGKPYDAFRACPVRGCDQRPR
jgi:hypothetical protein